MHELTMNSPAAFHDRARLLQSIHFTRDYYFLGRIQDFTKGGSDKRPPKAVAPRGARKIFNFRASEMRFPAFSGAI